MMTICSKLPQDKSEPVTEAQLEEAENRMNKAIARLWDNVLTHMKESNDRWLREEEAKDELDKRKRETTDE